MVVGIHVVSSFTVTEERRDDRVGHLGSRSFQISRRDPWCTGAATFSQGSSSKDMCDRGLGGSTLGGYMPCVPRSAEGSSVPLHSGIIPICG